LRFFEPVELARLLDDACDGGRRRHVRLRIALDGEVHASGKTAPIRFSTISQQGATIDSEKWLMVGELIRIECVVLPPIYAKVRWRDHPHYGVIFEHPFQLEDLARRCADLPAA